LIFAIMVGSMPFWHYQQGRSVQEWQMEVSARAIPAKGAYSILGEGDDGR
jgi:hypothetical protein